MTLVKIDTRAFNSMCRELAQKANVPDEVTLVAEVGKVLEKAIEYTPAASRSNIQARFDNKQFTTYSSKVYYLLNRYPDALWGNIDSRRKKDLSARLRAIGLSKKSWIDIAQRLGINVKAPAYARNAVARTGKNYQNVKTSISRQKGKLTIGIFNSQPTVNLPSVGGRRALQAAIDGRVKFFLGQMALKTFDDAAKIAKKYPGIRVT
jgi:hypothetical protein